MEQPAQQRTLLLPTVRTGGISENDLSAKKNKLQQCCSPGTSTKYTRVTGKIDFYEGSENKGDLNSLQWLPAHLQLNVASWGVKGSLWC